MTRTNALLAALGAVLMLVLFWMFLYSPKSDEVAAVRAETQAAQDQQVTLQTQIAALRDVRAQIPEVEAVLAAAASVVPESAALPATLRQLQQAADDSGLLLTSVAPQRPVAAEAVDGSVLPPDLVEIPLSISLQGGYFQAVDFLRRIEDPSIVARGIVWTSLDATVGADYPTLDILLTGSMFARIDPVPVPGATPDPSATESESESPTDAAAATEAQP